MTRIYVGNLAASVSRDDLETHFAQIGRVSGALVIVDRVSKQSRGFGFVEMVDAEEALTAIDSLHDTELNGQRIQIDPPVAKGSGRSGSRRRG